MTESSRRDFLATLAALGGAAALGAPGFALARPGPPAAGTVDLAARARDWAWLTGNWEVWHRRLKERLAGSDDWEEFAGRSAAWSTMGGLGAIDDNIVALPGGTYRGLSIRAFDPETDRWSIWWLDGRTPARFDPPVLGGFEGDVGTFVGRDTFKGRPITMRFRWRDIHGPRPWWEQAFSTDEGVSWEVNWRNWFTRTATGPTPLPRLDDAPHDFDFLAGRWDVRHRRLRQRLVGSDAWDEFGGTFVNWPVLGGHGNVDDSVFEFPAGTVRGVGFCVYDPAAKQWLNWWLDGRTPATIAPPVRGGFADGVGTFIGDDVLDGRPVKTRVQWTRITPHSARWEQSCSADDGLTWELNWTSDFARTG